MHRPRPPEVLEEEIAAIDAGQAEATKVRQAEHEDYLKASRPTPAHRAGQQDCRRFS